MVDPKLIRRTTLDILYSGGAGHLGSALSTVEMLTAMYASVDVDAIKRGDPDRDRVVISKGHCAAAVYATLHHYGLLDAETLATYYREGSPLTGLVNHAVPGVEHSTGSLGHGLSVAAGMARALKRRAPERTVLCLLGDGEVQEGSNWEAAALLHHHQLTNCVVLVDDNKICMIDRTEKVLNMTPLRERFAGFGLTAIDVDGHDATAIRQGIRAVRANGPGVIICHTVKGKGAKFAENDPLWHYRTLTQETYESALEQLTGQPGAA